MGIFKKNSEKKKESGKALKTSEKAESKKKESMKDLYSDKTKEVKSSVVNKKYKNAHKVLVNPLVTEKATVEGTMGKYIFKVAIDSNKIEIAKAIEDVYGVKPSSVNIIKMEGKRVRYGRITGKRSDWKKAIVTLPKGKTINVYEGV